MRVNTLSPGGVLGGQDEQFKRKYCARVPLGRMATAEDLRGPLAVSRLAGLLLRYRDQPESGRRIHRLVKKMEAPGMAPAGFHFFIKGVTQTISNSMGYPGIPGLIPNWIDGRESDTSTGETLPKVSPVTGKEMCRLARSRSSDVGRAVAAAARAFGDWSALTPVRRAELLLAVARELERRTRRDGRHRGRRNRHVRQGRAGRDRRGDRARASSWPARGAGFTAARRRAPCRTRRR